MFALLAADREWVEPPDVDRDPDRAVGDAASADSGWRCRCTTSRDCRSPRSRTSMSLSVGAVKFHMNQGRMRLRPTLVGAGDADDRAISSTAPATAGSSRRPRTPCLASVLAFAEPTAARCPSRRRRAWSASLPSAPCWCGRVTMVLMASGSPAPARRSRRRRWRSRRLSRRRQSHPTTARAELAIPGPFHQRRQRRLPRHPRLRPPLGPPPRPPSPRPRSPRICPRRPRALGLRPTPFRRLSRPRCLPRRFSPRVVLIVLVDFFDLVRRRRPRQRCRLRPPSFSTSGGSVRTRDMQTAMTLLRVTPAPGVHGGLDQRAAGRHPDPVQQAAKTARGIHLRLVDGVPQQVHFRRVGGAARAGIRRRRRARPLVRPAAPMRTFASTTGTSPGSRRPARSRRTSTRAQPCPCPSSLDRVDSRHPEEPDAREVHGVPEAPRPSRRAHDVSSIATSRYAATTPHATAPGLQVEAIGTKNSLGPKCT